LTEIDCLMFECALSNQLYLRMKAVFDDISLSSCEPLNVRHGLLQVAMQQHLCEPCALIAACCLPAECKCHAAAAALLVGAARHDCCLYYSSAVINLLCSCNLPGASIDQLREGICKHAAIMTVVVKVFFIPKVPAGLEAWSVSRMQIPMVTHNAGGEHAHHAGSRPPMPSPNSYMVCTP
jgi:hypothetical protein